MESSRPFQTPRRLAWLLSLALAGCSGPAEQQAQEAPMIRPVKSLLLPKQEDVTRTFPGTVRATRRVDLSFNLPGTLKTLPVKEGQRVEKGELLAQLDLRDQKAAVEAARAEYQKALADYKRAKELIKKHFVSQAHFDKTRTEKDVAAAHLAQARKALEDGSLKAPFSGVIAQRYVENFTDVRAKQPIASLQDPRALEVVVDIPEELVAQYRKGSALQAKARFATLPGRIFPLSLKEFSTQADPATRTYQATFALSGNEGVNLLPGMTAEVTFAPNGGAASAPRAFTLPASALLQSEGGQWVWVIDPKTHRASRRKVQAGRSGGQEIRVTQGLEPGEYVAIAGVHHLKEGVEVRPVTEIQY